VLPERAARLLGRRTIRRPWLGPFRLAAQLAPHRELDDLGRTRRRQGPRYGVQMPLHQLSPLMIWKALDEGAVGVESRRSLHLVVCLVPYFMSSDRCRPLPCAEADSNRRRSALALPRRDP
jgi:hypothetical protein